MLINVIILPDQEKPLPPQHGSGSCNNKTAPKIGAALLWFIGGRMWVAPHVYEKEILVIYFIVSYYNLIMTKQCGKYELYVNIYKQLFKFLHKHFTNQRLTVLSNRSFFDILCA